jgi:hypothetical protein
LKIAKIFSPHPTPKIALLTGPLFAKLNIVAISDFLPICIRTLVDLKTEIAKKKTLRQVI